MSQFKVIEQKTGTTWIVGETGLRNTARELWVLRSSHVENPASAAKPGIVGFYSTRSKLEQELGNI